MGAVLLRGHTAGSGLSIRQPLYRVVGLATRGTQQLVIFDNSHIYSQTTTGLLNVEELPQDSPMIATPQ